MPEDKKPTFIVNGVEVDANGKPVGEAEVASAPSGDGARVSELEAQVDGLTQKWDEMKVAYNELSRKAAARASALQDDLDKVRDQVAALTKERDEFQDGLATCQGDRDALQQELDELRARPLPGPVLPPNFRDLLVSVDGVGEKLADKIIATVQPAPAKAE